MGEEREGKGVREGEGAKGGGKGAKEGGKGPMERWGGSKG